MTRKNTVRKMDIFYLEEAYLGKGYEPLKWLGDDGDLFGDLSDIVPGRLFSLGFVDIHNRPTAQKTIITIRRIKNIGGRI